MADPLTALMFAVQVMNFLKMLILKTLKQREHSSVADSLVPLPDPHDENGHNTPLLQLKTKHEGTKDNVLVSEVPILNNQTSTFKEDYTSQFATNDSPSPCEAKASEEPIIEQSTPEALDKESEIVEVFAEVYINPRRTRSGYETSSKHKKVGRKINRQLTTRSSSYAEKSMGVNIVSRINSKPERVEAWR